MPDLTSRLLPRLTAHRLPGLDLGENNIHPAYQRLSLASLPASLCYWLGAPAFGIAPLEDELLDSVGGPFEQVILLVVDGMGMTQWQRMLALGQQGAAGLNLWPGLAGEMTIAPLTSITPSTTTAALTSLWTGVPPAQHGIMGYEMWLREYGLVANMISHAPASSAGDVGALRRAGFDPAAFLPVPTLGMHLDENGVRCFALQHYSIARSGISTMLFNNTEVLPIRSQSDLWMTLNTLLDAQRGQRTYTYVYWEGVDDLSHHYGPRDERVAMEFAAFSLHFQQFLARRRAARGGRTLLVITADHGQVETPPYGNYDLHRHPEVWDCLHIQPTGEARLSYLFVRPGKETNLQKYIERTWPGQFRLLPSSLALQAGLFGPGLPAPMLHERIGDRLLVPQSSAYWVWANKENRLQGRHGGLSPQEMLIPLMLMEI
jgi:hypothetical protein